jgi:small-conductance mechanosensitive channel
MIGFPLRSHRHLKLLFSGFVISLFVATSSFAAAQQSEGASIVLKAETLFVIQTNLGPLSPSERAARAQQVISQLLALRDLDSAKFQTVEMPEWTVLRYDTLSILAISEEDARLAGIERKALAEQRLSTIRTALLESYRAISWQRTLLDLLLALGIVALALIALMVMSWIFPKIYDYLGRWEGTFLRPVRISQLEIISSRGLLTTVLLVPQALRLVLTIGVLYYALTALLSLIPGATRWGIDEILVGLAKTVVVVIATLTALKALRALEQLAKRSFDAWQQTRMRSIRIQTVEVISRERLTQFVNGILKLLYIGSIAGLLYGSLTLVFSFFEFTSTWASTLVRYVTEPLLSVLSGFVDFLPSLFFMIVVVFLTRFVIKVVKAIFVEIGKGAITFTGFHREWAIPTYKIARFLIIAFAAVIIFPYLPGSDSDAFKGISVFLGILFSLGSAGAISNIMAGLVLTYMRPFRIGDRVKIGDTMGDVIEKTLLITRVRTTKNVDITIPNAQVLSSHILNYSTMAREEGLILHTTVTIGYDAPWRTVHQLLIDAALATEGIRREPPPFVLQKSLDDFYVSYELNAYTSEAESMARTYSVLHQNIQDKFNEAGIEIMSPHYRAERDGNESTIPRPYRISSAASVASGKTGSDVQGKAEG